MTYKEAKETIIDEIRTRLQILKIYEKQGAACCYPIDTYKSLIRGMLICLKLITPSNEFWFLDYSDDCIEFGYFDEDNKWFPIEI